MSGSLTQQAPSVVLLGLPEDDVERARDALGAFTVHRVDRLSELRGLLADSTPSAMLSEIWMPDGHCIEVSDLLAEMSPHTVLMVVASSTSDDPSALDLGSHHLLVLQRPLRKLELVSMVEYAVHVHTLRSDLAATRAAAASLRGQSDEATRLKSEFLSLISHELRTPLTEVIGYAELLVGGVPTGKVTEFAGHIVRSAYQLKTLIDDLMTLSKAEAGTLPLELSSFPIEHLIEGRVAEIVRDARSRGFTVDLSVESQLGLVTADSGKLTKVLQNLLSNALKFSPVNGRIGIEVSDAGSAVLFSVSDAGKGISPEKLRDLFIAFRQEDSSDRRQYGGLGIGLSIVKHFVTLHGGSLRVTSRPDRGTVFSFVIPRRPPARTGAAGRR